jgi:polyisoprenoid-binding protein YceI
MQPKRFLATVIVAGIASSAGAAETYEIDKKHADLMFSIEHMEFMHKHGWFKDFAGVLQYDAAKPENSKVVVAVKTASLDTALSARDQHLNSDQFLDSAKYPEIRFESTKVVPGENQALRVHGDLTMHGITKPITLNAQLNKAGPNPMDKTPTLGFSATGSLKRSDFGITTFLPALGDTVNITIEAEFRRAP